MCFISFDFVMVSRLLNSLVKSILFVEILLELLILFSYESRELMVDLQLTKSTAVNMISKIFF